MVITYRLLSILKELLNMFFVSLLLMSVVTPIWTYRGIHSNGLRLLVGVVDCVHKTVSTLISMVMGCVQDESYKVGGPG